MRAFLVAGIVLMAAIMVVGCGTEQQQDQTQEKAAMAKLDEGYKGHMQTTCPVMGNPINKDIYADYSGKRVYFCC